MGDEPHFDSGTYHCQQAAEKALKGWLTAKEIVFRNTHDLVELLRQCSQQYPFFSAYEENAEFLYPFATQFRYPGDIFEPPEDEAILALYKASEIVTLVKSELARCHPELEL